MRRNRRPRKPAAHPLKPPSLSFSLKIKSKLPPAASWSSPPPPLFPRRVPPLRLASCFKKVFWSRRRQSARLDPATALSAPGPEPNRQHTRGPQRARGISETREDTESRLDMSVYGEKNLHWGNFPDLRDNPGFCWARRAPCHACQTSCRSFGVHSHLNLLRQCIGLVGPAIDENRSGAGKPLDLDNGHLHFLWSVSCLLDQNLHSPHDYSVISIMDKLSHIVLGPSSLSSKRRCTSTKQSKSGVYI